MKFKEYKGINREVLLQFTKEELIDLLTRADEYTYEYEGFHPLEHMLEGTPEEKCLLYEETEETEETSTGRGSGVTMEVFDDALRDIYKQAWADMVTATDYIKNCAIKNKPVT